MSVDDNGVTEVTPVEGHAVRANSTTAVGNANGNDGAVAGTSSDTSIAGLSRLHIQKPRAKRLTDAAKQCQELTTSFISLLQKEQEREFKPDDEVDATFAGLANRMQKHLNPDQLEDVLQEINRVVTEGINNESWYATCPGISSMAAITFASCSDYYANTPSTNANATANSDPRSTSNESSSKYAASTGY